MKQKPNVLFWILVVVAIVSVSLFVFSLVLILTRETPMFTKNQLGDLFTLISSTINLFIVSWTFKHRKGFLYGMSSETESQEKDYK
jgi:amino acid permease